VKIKLEKISINKNRLRTNIIEGDCESLPKVGQTFIMTAPPLEAGDIRVIETSYVIEATNYQEKIEFKTQNSSYRLTFR
jgi:hypothetical protein